MLFFSLSHSKLIPYILPALPPLAVLASLQLDRLLKGDRPAAATRILLVVGSLLCAFFGAAFVWAGAGRVKALDPSGALSVPILAAGSACVLLGLASAAFSWSASWKRAVPAMILCAAASFGCIWSAGSGPGRIPPRGFLRGLHPGTPRARRPHLLVPLLPAGPARLPRRPIAVAAFQGELEFGISKLSEEERRERFPTAANSPPSGTRRPASGAWWTAGRLCPSSPRTVWPAPVILQERRQVLLLTNRPMEGGRGA